MTEKIVDQENVVLFLSLSQYSQSTMIPSNKVDDDHMFNIAEWKYRSPLQDKGPVLESIVHKLHVIPVCEEYSVHYPANFHLLLEFLKTSTFITLAFSYNCEIP